MKKISLIVAMDRNRLIGINNKLPWRLPDDMKWFVEKTMGKPVVMGRKTYDSIPSKFKPLSGRENIIITRNPDYKAEGCTIVHSIESAIQDVPEIIIAGGTQIYELCLPIVNRIYLTEVDGEFEGDAYFPELDLTNWQETYNQKHTANKRNSHAFTWVILDKKEMGY